MVLTLRAGVKAKYTTAVPDAEIKLFNHGGGAVPFGCSNCKTGTPYDVAFTMAYQPILDEAGTVFAYEALVRGVNGEPARSVLAAVTEANRYAFDQACRVRAIDLAFRLGILGSDALLSINFMPNAVYVPRACIRQTMAAAEAAGIPPSRLIFELTENERMEAPHLQNILRAYREIGFKTAIDDFGAGYSGLVLLTRLQPDFVKIDMELVRDIDTIPVKQVTMKHIITLLNDLGITIICEGIETAAELNVLTSLGVDLFQGYLLGKPALEALSAPDLPAPQQP